MRVRKVLTRLISKPKYAVDLDTGAVVGVEVHPADHGGIKPLSDTLDTKNTNLEYMTKERSRDVPAKNVLE